MTTYPPTREGILAALDALGSTADEVAATLLRLGFKGAPIDCDTCPVAHYLADALPGYRVVRVFGDRAVAYNDRHWGSDAPRDLVEVPLPAAVSTFIVHFDGGKEGEVKGLTCRYPDLIEEPSHG